MNFLSQLNNNPGISHWLAAERILRFLKGTQSKGLCFHVDPSSFTNFIGDDRASDVNDRKSFTGYIFQFTVSAISWESRRQRIVALSTTTEAEFMALSETTKESSLSQHFLNELSHGVVIEPTNLMCDKQDSKF